MVSFGNFFCLRAGAGNFQTQQGKLACVYGNSNENDGRLDMERHRADVNTLETRAAALPPGRAMSGISGSCMWWRSRTRTLHLLYEVYWKKSCWDQGRHTGSKALWHCCCGQFACAGLCTAQPQQRC